MDIKKGNNVRYNFFNVKTRYKLKHMIKIRKQKHTKQKFQEYIIF